MDVLTCFFSWFKEPIGNSYFIIIAYMYLNQRKLLYLPSENNYLDDEIQFEFKEIFLFDNKEG